MVIQNSYPSHAITIRQSLAKASNKVQNNLLHMEYIK